MTRARVPLHALLGLAVIASLGAPESLVSVPPRRRCACCRAPSNRCPCRHCGSCSTSGHAPEVAPCACGSKTDPAGDDRRVTFPGELVRERGEP